MDRLEEFNWQYNTGAHQSLGGLSPFHLFYGREPNGYIDAFEMLPGFKEWKENPEVLNKWKEDVKHIRANGLKSQKKAADAMVKRHAKKHPPSNYNVGDAVIVKLDKSKKRVISKGLKSKSTAVGKVIEKKGKKYLVEYISGPNNKTFKTWFTSSSITSTTRDEERKRQKEARGDSAMPAEEEVDTASEVGIPVSLRNRLRNRGLDVVNVRGDGNCFFRAISHQVHGNAQRHDEIRQLAIQYIIDHPDQFSDALLNNDVNAFVFENVEDQIWADNEMVQAVSNALELNIEIISSAPETTADHVATPRRTSDRWVTIGLIGQTHYVSTHPCKTPVNNNLESQGMLWFHNGKGINKGTSSVSLSQNSMCFFPISSKPFIICS